MLLAKDSLRKKCSYRAEERETLGSSERCLPFSTEIVLLLLLFMLFL